MYVSYLYLETLTINKLPYKRAFIDLIGWPDFCWARGKPGEKVAAFANVNFITFFTDSFAFAKGAQHVPSAYKAGLNQHLLYVGIAGAYLKFKT